MGGNLKHMVDYSTLLGREWCYGVHDCYTLVRDFYQLNNIHLPDFKRPDDLNSCESVFLEQAPSHGFIDVGWGQHRPGDMLVFKIQTASAMHGGIYVGDMQLLHQRMNSLSVVEQLHHYYIKRVCAVFRYGAKHSFNG
jgi:cell wall-associated NlpC family hydrolase